MLKNATLLLAFIVFAWNACASITVLNYYSIGDGDPGATAGGIATNLVDSAGTNDLEVIGDPLYSADVTVYDNTLLSLDFNGANYAIGPLLTNLTDNFGIEAWVKTADSSGAHVIVYNGNTGESGWGLVQDSATGDYMGLFGNSTVIGAVPAPAGQWVHLALVRDNGTATFYVNGIAAGSSTLAPNTPSGSFAIAATPESQTQNFLGNVDDVRVFTFSPGAFSPTDLLYHAEMKLSLANQGQNIELSWPFNEPPFRLQYTTNLVSPNWITLTNFVITNATYTVNESPADAVRFYRLYQPPGQDFPPVVVVVDNYGTPVALPPPAYIMDGSEDEYFDASQSTDPRGGTLSYHWVVTTPTVVGFADRGITGYRTSLLAIEADSIPDFTKQDVTITLTVTHEPFDPYAAMPQSTTNVFRVAYVNSELTLAMSEECLGCSNTNTVGNCGCYIPQGFPPFEQP